MNDMAKNASRIGKNVAKNAANNLAKGASNVLKTFPSEISKSSKVIQIVIALIVVLIFYIIALYFLNTDSLVVFDNNHVKQNEKIDILVGKQSVAKLAGRYYNTVNSFSENFLKIGRSINDRGGSQFTYQFWMRINQTEHENFKDLTILMKGDNRKYSKGLYDVDTQKKINNNNNDPDYLVKCPLIKFGDSYKNMIIEFNTSKTPMAKMEVVLDGSSQDRKNLLSLAPLSWYLITYVIQDSFSHAFESENGINVSLYVNDFPYQVSSAATNPLLRNNYLKQNDGNLYLFPDVKVVRDFMQLSNIRYFNYALPYQEIANTFVKGPSLVEEVDSSEDGKNKPAFISAYNKIDVYNY
jgi:hypothetical protein